MLPPNKCLACGFERCKCPKKKKCEWCYKIFSVGNRKALETRRFCSDQCSKAKQKLERAKTRRFRLCCICGRKTRHVKYNTKKTSLVHCDRKSCSETVRLRKNERIRQARLKEWKQGKRKRTNHWASVPRVSKAELVIKDWFLAHHWKHQFPINTQIRNSPKTPPICYRLDFAKPSKKIYVEIDGTVHRNKIESDKRRDQILSKLGWRGLRINANLITPKQKKIKADLESVKRSIYEFENLL